MVNAICSKNHYLVASLADGQVNSFECTKMEGD